MDYCTLRYKYIIAIAQATRQTLYLAIAVDRVVETIKMELHASLQLERIVGHYMVHACCLYLETIPSKLDNLCFSFLEGNNSLRADRGRLFPSTFLHGEDKIRMLQQITFYLPIYTKEDILAKVLQQVVHAYTRQS